MKRKLKPSELKEIADYFKVLSEESRLKILHSLFDGAKNVSQIAEETELEQANVSRHLKTLSTAGVLIRRTEGVNAYYEIENQKIFTLCDFVCREMLNI